MRLKKYLEKLRISKVLMFEIVILFLLIFYYFRCSYFVVCVMGDSMMPTFKNHQFVYVSKDVDDLQPGQVVVFKNDNEVLIKRVARLDQGTYWVNYKSPALYYVPESQKFEYDFFDKTPIEYVEKRHILDDEVFVLGDNLPISIDSRSFGPIKKSNIIGVLKN